MYLLVTSFFLAILTSCSQIPKIADATNTSIQVVTIHRGVASQGVECLEFDNRVLKGPKFCVGSIVGIAVTESEYSSTIKKYTTGKVLEIDPSAQELDTNQPISFLIQISDDKQVRLTSKEIVLINKEYCKPNRIGDACVGDEYPTSYTNTAKVVGFSIPTKSQEDTSALLYLSEHYSGKINQTYRFGEANYDIQVHKTGTLQAGGSCGEGLLYSLNSTLKKCAAKEALKNLTSACENLSPPKTAQITFNKNESQLIEQSTCDKSYSIIGTSTTTCSVQALGTCVSRRILK